MCAENGTADVCIPGGASPPAPPSEDEGTPLEHPQCTQGKGLAAPKLWDAPMHQPRALDCYVAIMSLGHVARQTKRNVESMLSVRLRYLMTTYRYIDHRTRMQHHAHAHATNLTAAQMRLNCGSTAARRRLGCGSVSARLRGSASDRGSAAAGWRLVLCALKPHKNHFWLFLPHTKQFWLFLWRLTCAHNKNEARCAQKKIYSIVREHIL